MDADSQFVYILKCSDQTFYTGYTINLEKRLKLHNLGKGAKYTRGRTPCEIVYVEEFLTKRLAMQREYAIKKLTRKEKIALIDSGLKGVPDDQHSKEL